MRLRDLLAAAMAAALAGSSLTLQACDTPKPIRETKDRLGPEQRAAMVQEPVSVVLAGDFEGGTRKFEALLAETRQRSGQDSLMAADLISAFAIGLLESDHGVESLGYFKRGIDAYTAACGPNHPETALALTDYARATEEVYPGQLRPEVLPILERALKVRLATLGFANAETAMSMEYLAKIKADPRLTHGDPAKVDEVVALLRQAVASVEAAPNALPRDKASVRYRLVEVLKANGRESEARVEQVALDRVGVLPPELETRDQATRAALAVMEQLNAARASKNDAANR